MSAAVSVDHLVERWLPGLANELEHWVLLPACVVGQINRGNQGGFGPTLNGWVEPLPPGSSDRVDISISTQPYDYTQGRDIWRRQRHARPEAARWLSGRHGSLSFELGGRTPIADAVYAWLVDDLRRLGLVDQLVKPIQGAFTPWDPSEKPS